MNLGFLKLLVFQKHWQINNRPVSIIAQYILFLINIRVTNFLVSFAVEYISARPRDLVLEITRVVIGVVIHHMQENWRPDDFRTNFLR